MHTTATTQTAGTGQIERRGRPVGFWSKSASGYAARTVWGDFFAPTLLALVSLVDNAGQIAELKAKARRRAISPANEQTEARPCQHITKEANRP